jgi:hypothetical protein
VIQGLFQVWIASWHSWYHTLGECFAYRLLFHSSSLLEFIWYSLAWFGPHGVSALASLEDIDTWSTLR